MAQYTIEMNDNGTYDVGMWTNNGKMFGIDNACDCNLDRVTACRKANEYNKELERYANEDRMEARLLYGNMYEPVEVE